MHETIAQSGPSEKPMNNLLLKLTSAAVGACLLLSPVCLADEAKPDEKPLEKAAPIALKFALAQNISGLGRVVAFSLTARNVSSETQTLVFNSSQSFEITATLLNPPPPVVKKKKRKAPVQTDGPLWRWSSEKVFSANVRRENLLPGESKIWSAVWQGEDNLGNPAPQGQYVFEATVTADNELKAPPLMLDVRPEGIRELAPGKNDLDAGLNAKLETDKTIYQRGESAQLTLNFKNESGQTTALTFPSGQRYDFAARPAPKGKLDPKQKIIWQWSAGRAFTMALSMQSFAPNTAFTYSEKWDLKDLKGDPLPPGKYALEGMVTANRGVPSPPVIIEIRE